MAYSIMQLVAHPGKIVAGEILLNRQIRGTNQFETIDLAQLQSNSPQIRSIRGKEIAMIFQEPMTSLSMFYTVGFQVIEAIQIHTGLNERQARQKVIELLDQVSIPKPDRRVDDYPFQLSGGMRQRVMIAMALSCEPSMLIADEPTTALDVTTQAQILELMKKLQQDTGMSIMLITHDLGVVAEMCKEVVVMYLGMIVEQAPVEELFYDPLHPYTRALLASIPKLGHSKSEPLNPIKGMVPDPYNRPTGCPFHPRCRQRIPGKCNKIVPSITQLPDGRQVSCLLYAGSEPQ
jgi:peptide/nickel transport system ATP-binding protein